MVKNLIFTLIVIITILLFLPLSAWSQLGTEVTIWERPDIEAHRDAIFTFSDEYMEFLSSNKTVSEVVLTLEKNLVDNGFSKLNKAKKLRPGDTLYTSREGKILGVVRVGKKKLSKGLRIIATHIDSVRLDTKPVPIYDDGNLVFFETHYYGQLKPYQWLSIPLALHGTIVLHDGSSFTIKVGEDEFDPVFVIPDLLYQLAWMSDLEEGEEVPAEKLDPVVSHIPMRDSDSPYKDALMELLKQKYSLRLADFATAELTFVPAFPPRSVGFDGGLIGGYGQDDRLCSYAAFQAILTNPPSEYTEVVLFVDRREVGHSGSTGLDSNFLVSLVEKLADLEGSKSQVQDILVQSKALWVDVTPGANPHYNQLYDNHNVAFLGSGPSLNPIGTHAEFATYVRGVLEENEISYQTGEPSKVFTAKTEWESGVSHLSRFGMEVMELSVPVLSMHSAYELSSKADLYFAFKAYKAFLGSD